MIIESEFCSMTLDLDSPKGLPTIDAGLTFPIRAEVWQENLNFMSTPRRGFDYLGRDDAPKRTN